MSAHPVIPRITNSVRTPLGPMIGSGTPVAILRAVSRIKLYKGVADVHVCHTAYQRNALGTNESESTFK
jgi:hypothetical protein